MERINMSILPCEKFESDNSIKPFSEMLCESLHVQFGIYIHVTYFEGNKPDDSCESYTCNLYHITEDGSVKRLHIHTFTLPVKKSNDMPQSRSNSPAVIPIDNGTEGDLITCSYKISVSTNILGAGVYQVGIENSKNQLITASAFTVEIKKA